MSKLTLDAAELTSRSYRQPNPEDDAMGRSAKTSADAHDPAARCATHVLAVLVAALSTGAIGATGALAQQADDPDIEEVVVVTGTRSTIQSSIEAKRASDTVVEVLSAEDIGDIPSLSIGEALETLTSAAAHRDQGTATEVSIRGMGPFLGSTVFNGREATNGSGDRSVNFSMFPSELFSKLQIYKTQQASLIEGGVSGQIALGNVRPIDYGKRRFQGDLKGNYNPNNANINIAEVDWGHRASGSYIDQFQASDGGTFGIAVGLQQNVVTNPEQEYRTSSAWRDCRNDPSVSAGVYSSSNCDSGQGDLRMEVDPSTGLAPDAGTPVLFVPSQRSFRQNITDDERDSVFLAAQWQPSDRLDLNVDYQSSDRVFAETRNDLVFAEQRRVNPEGLVVSASGIIQAFNNNGRVETLSTAQERLEEYRGGGFAASYQVNDRLELSLDVSNSSTSRRENIIHTRLQSEPRDIHGNTVPAGTDRPDASYVLSGGASEVAAITVTNFDVTNHDLFADNARTRVDLNQARENDITAVRADFHLLMDGAMIYSLEGGVRSSALDFQSWPRVRLQESHSDSAIPGASMACRNDVFPEDDFLSEPANGQPLITNVDENGNVIAQGTGNTFATFDPLCLARELFGGEIPAIPAPRQTVGNVDVEERTLAAYVQANYRTEFAGKPVRGNFGLRVVRTDVDSTGLRTTFTSSRDDDGTLTINEDSSDFYSVVGGDSYTELLPSFNAVLDMNDDVLLRVGGFRGLSRPDPADMGFGRVLSVDDEDATSISEVVGRATANGNPDLEPLTSWNLDVAVEWYPNADSILALGTYYKSFLGGFENTQRVEQFLIDSEPFNADVTTSRTIDDASTLFGFEMTVAHAFTYLPGYLSGLGGKLSYNWADADFEFEDQTFGASLVVDESGNVVSERVRLTPPAGLFGFSEQVMSAQLYYQIGALDLQLIYKHRSSYFQQFVSSPGIIRYIGDTSVVEARATYEIADNVTVRVEALNLFDEPRKNYIPTPDSLSELNSYGPRVFVGIRAKF